MILRLQVGTKADTAFPRDVMSINPHFATLAVMTDADQLCSDLASALDTWMNDKREITVKAYDAQGSKPVAPIGEATVQTGVTPASTVPREVACCLSYFSNFNRPSLRGRLYIPAPWQVPQVALRPTITVREKIGQLADIFANLGGADVDWVVFSRKNNSSHPVTNWWVDDEWDTVRSRGLRPTTRSAGTVNEA
jgi:hypothetical protein